MEYLLLLIIIFILGSLESYLRDKPDKPSSTKSKLIFPIDNPYFKDIPVSSNKLPKTNKGIVEAIAEIDKRHHTSLTPKALKHNWDKPDYIYISAEAKHTYLKSKEWSDLRSKALAIANHQCQYCSSPFNLNCHHIKYEWLSEGGDNELQDLTILCQSCHTKLHNKLGHDRQGYYPISELENIL